MEHPNWEKGDSLRSIRDVLSMGRVAVAQFIEKLSGSNEDE